MKMYEAIKFNNIYGKIKGTQLPLKTGYKFLKLFQALEKDVEFYYDKTKELIDKYSEKNEDGTYKFLNNGESIQLQQDKIQDYQKDFIELENIEIKDIPDIKFTLDELDTINLSIDELQTIFCFIEE